MFEKTSKTDILIICLGVAFMFLLLYHVLGSTHDGIYSVAEVKSIQELEGEDPESNEKIFAVELGFKSGPHSGQTMKAEHFESPGSIYNLNLTRGKPYWQLQNNRKTSSWWESMSISSLIICCFFRC